MDDGCFRVSLVLDSQIGKGQPLTGPESPRHQGFSPDRGDNCRPTGSWSGVCRNTEHRGSPGYKPGVLIILGHLLPTSAPSQSSSHETLLNPRSDFLIGGHDFDCPS